MNQRRRVRVSESVARGEGELLSQGETTPEYGRGLKGRVKIAGQRAGSRVAQIVVRRVTQQQLHDGVEWEAWVAGQMVAEKRPWGDGVGVGVAEG